MKLTEQQQQQYQQQGYLVIDNFWSSSIRTELQARAHWLVEQLADQGQHQVFTTQHNDRQDDDYFLQSAEEICCFYEQEAYDKQGNMLQAAGQSINKLAHGLHERDPLFAAVSHTQALADIAAGIGIIKPQIRQSMYIFKPPYIGGEIKWHQDGSFFVTTPHSVVTFWFAIEEATRHNGCLWLQPGGHKGPLREQFIREGAATRMQALDTTPWPNSESALPVEVAAGALIVFHSHLPHYSGPNRSDRSRHAYTLHVTDAQCQYATENWLQADKLPLRGFV